MTIEVFVIFGSPFTCINVKNAVYRHVNGKIAQLKQQIGLSELGFLVVLHVDIDNVYYN